MDLELSFQASSRPCSDLLEPNIASQPSDSLDDAIGSLERSDGSADVTAIVVWTQHDNESQSVDGKAEALGNVSENAYLTPNMLDSADIEPTSNVPPPESSGEHNSPLSNVEVTQQVCTNIHTEEDGFPSSSPVVPSDGLDVYDLDIPTSSPPASSPLPSYFRSSSPIPTASSPCEYNLTPPTSPVKVSTELAKIQIEIFKEVVSDVEPLEFISDQSEIDIEETVGGHNENVTATVVGQNKDDAHPTDHGIAPREKVHQRLIPGPKRATLAAQKVRQQRLSKPFRPPTVQKTITNINPGNALPITAPGHNNTDYKPVVRTSSFAQKMQEKMKNRTAKAAAQFKSPLASSSAGGEEGPLVRPTPTIQALERKLQLLKRAVKVKENSEEEILCGLIQKWTEAGREIAWEVWGVVKENCDVGGRKRQMEDSWGWQDGSDSKRQKAEERLWGWDVIPVSERETEGPRQTMGAMLVEMGIAPETFGWNADEERFEDGLL